MIYFLYGLGWCLFPYPNTLQTIWSCVLWSMKLGFFIDASKRSNQSQSKIRRRPGSQSRMRWRPGIGGLQTAAAVRFLQSLVFLKYIYIYIHIFTLLLNLQRADGCNRVGGGFATGKKRGWLHVFLISSKTGFDAVKIFKKKLIEPSSSPIKSSVHSIRFRFNLF